MLYSIIPFITAMALRSIFGPVLLGRPMIRWSFSGPFVQVND
jgi:hypothetical protein